MSFDPINRQIELELLNVSQGRRSVHQTYNIITVYNHAFFKIMYHVSISKCKRRLLMSLNCLHLIKLVTSLVVIYNTLQRKSFHFQRTEHFLRRS